MLGLLENLPKKKVRNKNTIIKTNNYKYDWEKGKQKITPNGWQVLTTKNSFPKNNKKEKKKKELYGLRLKMKKKTKKMKKNVNIDLCKSMDDVKGVFFYFILREGIGGAPTGH